MIKIYNSSSELPEVKLIDFINIKDNRGTFLKFFEKEVKNNLNFIVDEVFLSKSKKDVIRGIHLQKNNYDLEKIVICTYGNITDLIIDLRKESKSYGKYTVVDLHENSNKAIFIPKGFGHGFKVNSEYADILYLQSGYYNGDSEIGINPLSFGYDWKIKSPVISKRDMELPEFDEY
tara:strand:+ start:103 stop:630 length:528 start_codon:yes stop_codon:yes gene_type:complete